MTAFGQRLAAAIDQFGHLMVGIDPHPSQLAAWGLPDDASGLRQFGLRLVEASAGRCPGVKPQSAFFERHGPSGVQALAEVLAAARSAGLVTLLDAKRGDIGSTMAGYGQAYLTDSSAFAVDALTVAPYLGFGSLTPIIDTALTNGRGLFVLALTSNPEGSALQLARRADGQTVAGAIAAAAAQSNAQEIAARTPSQHTALGSLGLVIGATAGQALRQSEIDLCNLAGPVLAPGFGAQGATAATVHDLFRPVQHGLLVPSARAISQFGPKKFDLIQAISQTNAELSF
ncbi:MAG: orotidine-5'-phosphate decarboxylase [Bifidobacteriaceae bacterium]|jgi:orotidine-5'-phosphate decarboxylase|nr:orotidine-5'-phosphate decarboxylase [Bifidobacteriaceae bacterium]